MLFSSGDGDMRKICLVIAYEGTDYVGWQYQPNGLSVQQCVEEALQKLTGHNCTVYSAGRTDAGVHALGMVCHFSTARDLPLSAWREGMNSFLPAAIAVRSAREVDESFHARFSATGKHYRYTLLCDPVRSPLERRTSWQLKSDIDLIRMRVAAAAFIGCHDFRAFRTTGCSAETTVREIFSVTLTQQGALVYIDIEGSGFLKNMIRMMVGTLVDIGRGKRPVDDIVKMLHSPGSVGPALTAPAHGLCLMQVYY